MSPRFSGDQLEWIQQCLAHGLYLVLGMIATSFIQAPPAVRCALILIVPLNLALTSYEGAQGALDFSGITLLLVLFSGGMFAVNFGVYCLLCFSH